MAGEDFSMLLLLERPIKKEELKVSFAEKYNREPTALDDLTEEIWRTALSKNPSTFDGSKFRLGKIKEGSEGVKISLGLTGYKEYLATNQLDEVLFKGLVDDGKVAFRNPNAHLSNALGCEALLLTSDDKALFLRRSSKVATHSGLYNGPSGHPEPKNIGVPAEGSEAIKFFQTAKEEELPTEDAIRNELFESVTSEIVAETNIAAENLSEPLLMACMTDSRRKPDMLFFVRASIDSEAITRLYNEGAEEGWESDRLAFVAVQDLRSTQLPFTAVTKAAIEAYLTQQGG